MPIHRRRVLAAGALAVVACALGAVAFGNGVFPANADDAHPYRVFVPYVAADQPKAPADDCAGDIAQYLNSSGANVAAEKFQVEGTGIAVEWFRFTNPCDAWIAPQRLNVSLTGAFGELDANIGAFPSLVPPGGDGFYALYFTTDLFDDPGLEYAEGEWTWEQLEEAAQLLTVDANGDDATPPLFDPELVVQLGYRANVIANHQGNPVVWPFQLALQGECPNGSLVFGQFTPYTYGYNPSGTTSFDGYVSWMDRGCNPDEAFTVLGYLLDEDFVAIAAGAQQNTLLPSNLTLIQSAPGTMRLSGSLTNTGQEPARPGQLAFKLVGDDPLQFQVDGFDMYFPGLVGQFVIQLPGEATDYSAIIASVTNIQAFPASILPTWYSPPTYIRDATGLSDVRIYDVVIPNVGALIDAYGDDGTLTVRHWRYTQSQQVRFSDGNTFTPMDLEMSAIPVEKVIAPGPEYANGAELWDAVSNETFRIEFATSHSAQE